MTIIFLIKILYKFVQVYSGILIIYALLSWFPGAYDSKFGRLIVRICEPYLRLFDRLNLSIGMVGFNVMIAIIVLNVVATLLERILLAMVY